MDALPGSLRRLVIERANERCEYCLLPQSIALHRHEPDHIIPRQHGGRSDSENLALARFRCNRYKGPNLGSIDPETGQLIGFYNPRWHHWHDHFQIEDGVIWPLTPEGRVKVIILRLNDNDRVAERRALNKAGFY